MLSEWQARLEQAGEAALARAQSLHAAVQSRVESATEGKRMLDDGGAAMTAKVRAPGGCSHSVWCGTG